MAADYGSSTGVVALVPRYGSSGNFTTGTRPTLAQVGTWLEEISDILNAMLAAEGFSTPISDTEVANICTHFVNQEVAAICEGVNGSGRFGPSGKRPRKSRFDILMDEVEGFVKRNSTGFTRLGATRSISTVGTIMTRSTDEAGDDVVPIFQRKGFGNIFAEWDA